MPSSVAILILAAGKGTRMNSALPKVLHPVAGIPMIDRVLKSVTFLKPKSLGVIIGHGAEKLKTHIKKTYPRSTFFVQKSLNGSGGAVRTSMTWLKKFNGTVLVTCGDMPLLQESTFRSLILRHQKEKNAATVLTAVVEKSFGYGRIVRGDENEVLRIVEELDATLEEQKINEINTGTYCFDSRWLRHMLPRLKNMNAKREYYLTDILSLLSEAGQRVGAEICVESQDALGINRRQDLALAEHRIRNRKLQELMASGVTIVDPASTYIDDSVKIGADTVIWPQTFLLGKTRVGQNCVVGPWVHAIDTKIENDVIFRGTFSEGGVVKKGALVGPFSRIRPGSVLGEQSHLGNFSEVKKTRLGRGAKVNHLSYLGDARVGKNVNIGAGTITCNYDGVQKHPTVIQDHAFIGSNVNLVAPIRIGAHAVVGAGSSLSRNVPPWSLALERAALKTKKGWVRQRKKKGRKK